MIKTGLTDEASFWISLDWFLMVTKPDRLTNQQIRDTYYRLRSVSDRRLAELNREYDESKKRD